MPSYKQLKSMMRSIFSFTISNNMKADKYGNIFLPKTRSNENLADNEEYIRATIQQIDEIQKFCSLTPTTHILDFGCGQGRFANGLLAKNQKIGSYCGIDTQVESIKWCKRYIEKYHPNFTFLHLPAYNPRYNSSVKTRLELPLDSNFYNLAVLNSVFSHMLADDVQFYLSQLFKVLMDAEGWLYLTAFIEENVPQVEENPENYIQKSVSRLHRVRYEKSFFFELVNLAGFNIISFQHQHIKRTKQSVLIAKKIV